MFITASIDDHNHDEEKKTKLNLIVCSHNLKRNLHSTYCTDRHEALHGLSVTAGLRVMIRYDTEVFNVQLKTDGQPPAVYIQDQKLKEIMIRKQNKPVSIIRPKKQSV